MMYCLLLFFESREVESGGRFPSPLLLMRHPKSQTVVLNPPSNHLHDISGLFSVSITSKHTCVYDGSMLAYYIQMIARLAQHREGCLRLFLWFFNVFILSSIKLEEDKRRLTVCVSAERFCVGLPAL